METPSFVILYSQAIGNDPENSMGDQLAILEARVTVLWARYSARKQMTSLQGDMWTLRQDLDLWEDDFVPMPESTDYGSSSACRTGTQQTKPFCMRQNGWFKARLDACRVVVSTVGARVCWGQLQEDDALSQRPAEYEKTLSRSMTNDLSTSAASALDVIAKAQVADMPTMRCLCSSRLLYIIAAALIDVTKQLESQQLWRLLDLLRSQIACAEKLLQHLGRNVGDQCSLEALEMIKLLQFETSS
jgi:hypothetical protein